MNQAVNDWANQAVNKGEDPPKKFPNKYTSDGESVNWTRDTVERLKEPGWFNGDLIGGFADLLFRDFKEKHIYVINSLLSRKHNRESPNGPQMVLETLTEKKLKLIKNRWFPENRLPEILLMPHNIGNYHWILLAYDVKSSIWYIYDSFNGNKHLDIIKDYHPRISKFLGRLENLSEDIPPITVNAPSAPQQAASRLTATHQQQPPPPYRYKFVNVPQQTDGYQCGVWVCVYLFCIANGFKLSSDLASEVVHDFRLYIAKTMFTGNINLNIPASLNQDNWSKWEAPGVEEKSPEKQKTKSKHPAQATRRSTRKKRN